MTPALQRDDQSEPNVASEIPLKWTGTMMKKLEACQRFVFSGKVQIQHINGLTYDSSYDTLYGIDFDTDQLVTINRGTGAASGSTWTARSSSTSSLPLPTRPPGPRCNARSSSPEVRACCS